MRLPYNPSIYPSGSSEQATMPVVFIHGVNVRDRYQNLNDALAMGELLNERVLRPLAASGVGKFASIQLNPLLMRVPYWGDDGVHFAWHGATLPKLHATDILGGEEASGVPSETQVIALAALLRQGQGDTVCDQPLLQAARTDFPLFIDIVLEPIIESEVRLIEDSALQVHADDVGMTDDASSPQPFVSPFLEAMLIDAAEQVASDTELKQRVATQITNDDDLIDEVEKWLLESFREQVRQYDAARTRTSTEVDVLGGGLGGAVKEATDRIQEFFIRALQAPSRIPSVAALKILRRPLHPVFTRFSGDVFEYLLRRGDWTSPGKIVQVILAELDTAMSKRPGEPLIVITHSMGGNIFYDILTHFRPELEVDVWLSVGGQVGLFEEMKLFHASDPKVRSPQKVDQLGSRVRCWRNVYDPADPAAFLAEPVFANVKDVRYSTGAGDYHTHLNYFKRSRLYRSLREELGEAFKE